ncbi:LOW QUALITY PROTEIN: parathyroid hormone-like hormone b [Sinocyclocheilus rhinocerous]|uniref:LOW QUALITY PROTEIN: parathyroid hormone-like hormone b n=1 Tax=Sinocyclocheilus rhinocerous TaxID=307959 RepID=UPI0007BA448A|nr:PREDICTED: LOW QUALITY PROTEIN: parathyroid hormone-related protein-like [Sinocyclocheilus rhinocerous]
MLRHWGFAVFLLTIPIPVQPRPTNVPVNRQRRSVGHAQMMHDRGRSLHDRKRRMWIQELLEQVHTAQAWDSPSQSEGSVQTPQWSTAHRPKPISSTKNLPLSFQMETVGTRDDLPQETSKTLRYEEQPLKAVTKRKRKMSLGRWRDLDRRRDRVCGFRMQILIRDQ